MCKRVDQSTRFVPAGQSNGRPWFRLRLKAVAAFWVCVCAMAGSVAGIDAQPPGQTATGNGPIQITADELISQVKDNYAEFIGNVEVIQGDFEIRSDRLRIHYRRNTDRPLPDPAGGDAIEKIVAMGNVRIKSGSREAQTELAEYLVDEGLLVMRGENSTVTDGNNSIKGSVIKLNRMNGKISVAGGPSERVRAVFHSTGRIPAGGETDKAQEGAAASPKP